MEVEEHILRVYNTMTLLQRDLDLLIDSVINAQKGLLQNQVVTPVTLMGVLIKRNSAFPKDTTLPFHLSQDSVDLLFRFGEFKVYIKDGIFGYTILLPLVNRGNFNIYRLIPIPLLLDRSKFTYVDTGK